MAELDLQPIEVLLEQMERLRRLIAEEREHAEAMEQVVVGIKAELERHEFQLRKIESVLGKTPQIELEHSDVLLRGQRIREVAIEVLAEEFDVEAEVHYTRWYELVTQRGHLIAGKDPVNTFLTEINRSPRVKRVGQRTGLYRLLDTAA